jgi:hypothetical protein
MIRRCPVRSPVRDDETAGRSAHARRNERRRRRCTVLAADPETGLPLWNIFWTMLLFFLFALLVWLLIVVLRDVFARDDLTTWGKVGWTLLVILFPLVGSLVYLVMHNRAVGVDDQHAEERDLWRIESSQQRTYVPNFH